MLLGCEGQQCQCHLPSSQISSFSPYFFSNTFPFSSFVLFLSIFLFREEPLLMVRTQADRHKSVLSHPAPPLSRAAGITGQEQPLERWQKIYTASFFQDHCMKGGVRYLQGESCETTHLLIHYKTKTAPTRLYLILMFRLASYIGI